MKNHINCTKKENIKNHEKIMLFFALMVSLNPSFKIRVLWWAVLGVMVVLFLTRILTERVEINRYMLWSFIFIAFSFSSAIWALDSKYSVSRIETMASCYLILWFISIIVKTQNDIYSILKIFVFSVGTVVIYMFMFVDFAMITDKRYNDLLGDNWNPNFIGMLMSITVLTLIVLLKNENKKGHNFFKVIYYFLIFSCTFIVLFSGSKKALFILVFASGIYLVLSSRKHKSSIIVLVTLGCLAATYLILNVPILYNILGIRIQEMISYFTREGTSDYSTRYRMQMIQVGWNWFFKRPTFGYGLDNFKVLYGSLTGKAFYAHNNYIDLLVGVGGIGTIIYYYGYIYLLRNTISVLNKYNILLSLIFAFILTLFIADVGLVSYYELYIQLFVCIGFCAVKIEKEQHEDDNNKKTINSSKNSTSFGAKRLP